MRFYCCAFAVVYICCVCVLYCNTETIYRCATSSNPMILRCQDNEMVTGFVKSGSRKTEDNCTKQEGDCLDEKHFKIKSCVWKKKECSFSRDNIGLSSSCFFSGSIKYIVAEHFQCVPAENLHQICVTKSKELYAPADNNHTKYILSRNFQLPYSQKNGPVFNQSLCSVTITTEPGYGIKLFSYFMDINQNDHILITGKESNFRRTFTGRDSVEVFVPENNVEFSFIVQAESGNVGFALVYESFFLNNTNSSDYTIPPETTSPKSDTTAYDTTTIITDKESPTTNKTNSPLSTWVPVIIATALVVLVVLLTAVTIMVCRHKKGQSSTPIARSENGSSGRFPQYDGSGVFDSVSHTGLDNAAMKKHADEGKEEYMDSQTIGAGYV